MKIHEYQAKQLLKDFGVPVSTGPVASTAAEAREAANALGCPVVLKAQVHVGGRGKAGGVKVVESPEQAERTAAQILELTIKDLPVRKLLVAPAVNIDKEVYLSLLIDRGARTAVFIGCAEGGVDIEETAKTSPDKILRCETPAAQLKDLAPETVADLANQLFPRPDCAVQAAALMVKMARLFSEKDCSLIEINPLVVTSAKEVLALDAKVILDDNALYRHEDLLALRDPGAEDPDEVAAKEAGLSFIRLQGGIGCMVNGAGLAMATMDTIKHFGGEPANFLDVGGSSDPKKVVAAFRAILKDPSVKVILINIFGGITRCDDIAKGILASMDEFDVPVPIVIRLIGTNEEEGRALLAGREMITAATLDEGAAKAAEIGGRS
jgi:succinyl-CoA synthetase beta subunit